LVDGILKGAKPTTWRSSSRRSSSCLSTQDGEEPRTHDPAVVQLRVPIG